MHDHDVGFTAAVWKAHWGILGMRTLFNSANYPQTDSKTKQQKCTSEQVIHTLAYKGENWVQFLTLVELAINSHWWSQLVYHHACCVRVKVTHAG